eukprot:TRINITY_DN30180_c0_g1_i1.p1 TRINITY_DN30180_c0_g1~~TRINITY_DN30180_c0_g1_i1.p1  ORF type:complete len:359 (-),score=44.93 TRINITY_DN30180_c0_g1_i1:211-1287(-)
MKRTSSRSPPPLIRTAGDAPHFGRQAPAESDATAAGVADREHIKQGILKQLEGQLPERDAQGSDSSARLHRANDSMVHHRNSVPAQAPCGYGGCNSHSRSPSYGRGPLIAGDGPSLQLADKRPPPEVVSPLFTFGCVILFLPPILQAVYLAGDVDVKYWIGSWFGHVAVLLPLVFVGSFFFHLRHGRPHRTVLVLCLLIPSVVLLGIGQHLVVSAQTVARRLGDSKCNAMEEKQKMQDSADALQSLFQSCVAAGENQVSQGVQWCSQYEASRAKHRSDWDYLLSTEERFNCGGWCDVGQQLFLPGAFRRDPCSEAVSESLRRKVVRTAAQLRFYSFFVMAAVSVAALCAAMSQRCLSG